MIEPYLGGISAEFVTFSPDGNSLAYVTFPEGILWRANRDGSGRVQMTDPPMYPSCPDGRLTDARFSSWLRRVCMAAM